MTSELLYYVGKDAYLTEVVFDTSQPNDTQVIATYLRKFYSPPPLKTLYSWQSFVVGSFPEVEWNAKVKIDMRSIGTVDRPVRVDREFTLTLKGKKVI